MKKSEKISRENLFKPSEEVEGITIKGYDFNKGINYEKIIDSYAPGFKDSIIFLIR